MRDESRTGPRINFAFLAKQETLAHWSLQPSTFTDPTAITQRSQPLLSLLPRCVHHNHPIHVALLVVKMALLEPPLNFLQLLRQSLPEGDYSIQSALIDESKGSQTIEEEILSYVSFLAAGLADAQEFDVDLWKSVLQPYLEDSRAAVLKESAASVVERFCIATEQSLTPQDDAESYGGEDDEAVEELCNLRFNLAYGGKILLHQTKLHLLRGRRYALVGKNGVGKSVYTSQRRHEECSDARV
jgi:hypothetical protein